MVDLSKKTKNYPFGFSIYDLNDNEIIVGGFRREGETIKMHICNNRSEYVISWKLHKFFKAVAELLEQETEETEKR